MGLYGSYYILAGCPVWVIVPLIVAIQWGGPALLSLVVPGAVPFNLNVSWSTQLGDLVGLLGVVLIGWTVLQRQPELPWWSTNSAIHATLIVLCFTVSALYTVASLKARQGGVLDMYHDFVTMPLYAYFCLSLVPVIWIAGTRLEFWAAWCFAGLWAVLLVFDLWSGRFVQPKWIKENVLPILQQNLQ